MTFKNLGLSEELVATIERVGYTSPTPVQKESIPAILQGQDLLVCAQTGTGKTASFLLPTIDVLSHSRSRQGLCSAIILVPTRELAAQVFENFNTLSAGTRLKAISIVGGEVISAQERLLKKGVDVIIATPGRVLDLYDRGKIIFTNIKMVVLDEADRMLDMGFMPEVDRILSVLPKLRQTLLFSATVPQEIKKISNLYQIQPKEIKVTHSTTTEALIDQFILRVTEAQKRPALCKLLRDKPVDEPAIVFCNRKREISALTSYLGKNGFTAESLHGDMSQRARNDTLDRFRQDLFKVLVTSDVAARGIDIIGISLVVNHDVPINEEDYVHRIGRTGRAGKEGKAITFVLKLEAKRLKKIEDLIKKSIPEMTLLPEDLVDSDTVVQADSSREDSQGRRTKPAQVQRNEPKSIPQEALKDRSVSTTTRVQRPRRDVDSDNSDLNQPIVGFGKMLPSFMLLDPLDCLRESK